MSAEDKQPRHIAIIMDGNGRWAQKRNKPRTLGHSAGARTAVEVIRACDRLNVQCLTLFAFSTENWDRPDQEVGWLLRLFTNSLQQRLKELEERGARLCFIGDRSGFPDHLLAEMRKAEVQTAENTRLQLNVAVGYGGQQDITEVARQLAQKVQDGELRAEQIDKQLFENHLALGGQPPPDLFIRTGGELRVSNFLLWQLAYAELYFTDILWPDFDAAALDDAIRWYARRDRRFGKIDEQQD